MSNLNADSLSSSLLADLERFRSYIKKQDSFATFTRKNKKVILFLSLGYLEKRARVFTAQHVKFDQAWEAVKKKALQFVKLDKTVPSSLKIDMVDEKRTYSILEFIKIMTSTRKNYFRRGVSFYPDFKYAFLEQEVNGNSFIQIDSSTNRGYLNERNIQHYIKTNRPDLKPLAFNAVSQVIAFTTVSFFYQENSCWPLKNTELDYGRRDTKLDREELKYLIKSGADFLARNVQSNGKFTYGYFSCFDVEINFYNMLRHASTVYSMCEVYECFPDDELMSAIKKSLNYLIAEGIAVVPSGYAQAAYVIDGMEPGEQEIKLGANAAAILALTKYMEITGDYQYLPIARQLAHGIISLQREDGSFRHVLHYPSLELKEEHRIIYYDGEAAFAMMRLYKVDRNELWLETVERGFEHFIEQEYWKHHDHWLSYCTNELTEIKPLLRYFQFGLLNVRDKLDFIYQRETTYPTFLELTLAAYQMVARLHKTEHRDLLKAESFDEKKLVTTIHKRAEYQRNGFFYPEMAMYLKNPQRIMGSFFIRHHSFRARIDDVEHNLSGYCQYYKQFYQQEQELPNRSFPEELVT